MTLASKASSIVPASVLVLSLIGCTTGIGHNQGEMAGEVTAHTVILQSRLTPSGLIDKYCSIPLLPCGRRGTDGVARFEIATDPGFQHAFMTEWIAAAPENDFIVKKKVGDLDPGTILALAFGEDRRIASVDHPILKNLRGEF